MGTPGLRSRILRLALLLSTLAGPGAVWAQPTTYSFTGDLYAVAQPPYTTSQRLNGSFTVASPLPPFRPLSSVAASLVSLTFSDGIQSRSLADSFLCRVDVATDGAGRITQWEILLRQSPYAPFDPQHSIATSGQVGFVQGADFAGTGPAAADPCGGVVLAPSASTSGQGIWSSDQPLPSDPETYAYAGAPYSQADPPYVLGGQLTGSVTFANPLPAFLPLVDISPAIVDFSFDDGVETRTLANSFLCGFELATDGAGEITRWSIRLRRQPYNPGDPQHSIDSFGAPGPLGGVDLAGTGAANADPCGPFSLAPYASTSAPGSWISGSPQPPNPTTYTYLGDGYTVADPPYTLGGALHGTVTLGGPLPAFLPLTDVTAAIVDFGFFDGVETRTLADSFLCSFELATDGAGRISAWQIDLRRFPYNPGDPHHHIGSYGRPGVLSGNDIVGTGVAPAGPCDGMPLTAFASTGSQGSWTTDSPLPSLPRIYQYTGAPYVVTEAPYVLGGNLEGTIELANPLPPHLPLTDISNAVTSFSFHDEIATRTFADSFVCGLEVATDGAGNIAHWAIHLRQFPLAPGTQHSIDSFGLSLPFDGVDLVGSGPTPLNGCDAVSLSPFATSETRGSWTPGGGSVLEVPTLHAAGLALLMVALAALGTARLRSPKAAATIERRRTLPGR